METPALDSQLDELDATLGEARRVLLRVETGACDVSQLARVRKLVVGFQNTLDAINADLAHRAGELRQGGSSKPTDDAMNPDHRRPPGAEQSERDRGDVYDQIPGLEDATKAGELSGRYGDIIARAVRNLNAEVRAEFYRRHPNLAEIARGMTEHRFRLHVQHLVEQVLADCGVERTTRQRRDRTAKTWNDIDTGMWNLRGSWDPETGAKINSNLDAEINALYRTARDDPNDKRTRPQMLADAVANLLCGTPAHSATGGRNGGTTVLVITDQHTVNDVGRQSGSGAGEARRETTSTHTSRVAESADEDVDGDADGATRVHEYSDGTPVALRTVRHLLADIDTTTLPVTINQHGVVTAVGDELLDHGRERRLATWSQRFALRAMHRTCLIAGCDTLFDRCEIHHLIEWEHGGRTDLGNLAPLCVRHHHLVHAEGWELRLDPITRELRIAHPDGTIETQPFTPLGAGSGACSGLGGASGDDAWGIDAAIAPGQLNVRQRRHPDPGRGSDGANDGHRSPSTGHAA